MSDIRGFIRWQLSGMAQWLRSLYFWGFVLVLCSPISKVYGCPVADQLFYIGGAMMLFTAIRYLIQWQYSIYRNEKEQVVRNLQRKA
jgi:hypothetical protein